MKKLFCPILLIGFSAPEKGQVDLRTCTEECALYDEANKQCSIKTCAEFLPVISGQCDDAIALASNFAAFEEYEDYEDYEYDPNSIRATN